jgi:glycerophosphoryl diester phosphodiesterase
MNIIGHRGARGLARENTIASIQKALSEKVSEIEIDVRVTADNVPVLMHGSNLLRMAGKPAKIANYTYDGLKTMMPDLSTLEDAIISIKKKVPLQIEVKAAEPVGAIVQVVQQFIDKGWAASDFLIASKHQPTLRALHKALPDVQPVIIESWSGVRARYRAQQVGAKRISMNYRWLWFGFIAGMHASGYEIAAYTLNDPKKAKRWQKYGLSAVITDYPDRFRGIL